MTQFTDVCAIEPQRKIIDLPSVPFETGHVDVQVYFDSMCFRVVSCGGPAVWGQSCFDATNVSFAPFPFE